MSEDELATQFTTAYRVGPRAALARRVELLSEASMRLDAERFARFLHDCWRAGDLREQQAILRALPALREPERWTPIAREGCRSNVGALFEAIAAENPYPARYFGEAELNQMVIKALFVGVEVGRIAGLEPRMNPSLIRMASDYASERRAAQRAVSDDVLELAQGRVPKRRSP